MAIQSLMSPAAISSVQATVHALALEPGLYAFMVEDGAGTTVLERMPFPSAQVNAGPTADPALIEMMGSRGGGWLSAVGDALVLRVREKPAELLLTIYKPVAQPELRLLMNICRLDGPTSARVDPVAPALLPARSAPAVQGFAPTNLPGMPQPVSAFDQPQRQAPLPQPQMPLNQPFGQPASSVLNQSIDRGTWGQRVLAAEIVIHVQNRGDISYTDSVWVGGVGQKLWIEAFSIRPKEVLRPEDIEYKALAANGMETPWIAGGATCGSRGMGSPLTGIAIRLRGPAADRYDCVYEASFVSGRRVGPVRNGGPCRSDVIGDPVEAFLLRIIEKGSASIARV